MTLRCGVVVAVVIGVVFAGYFSARLTSGNVPVTPLTYLSSNGGAV
jgi:hypothetical protein